LKYIPHLSYYRMVNQTNTSTLSPAQVYGDAGLIYIRYHAQIETKPNGQQKIVGVLNQRSARSPNRSTTDQIPVITTLC
ncbi:MAG: hypothetical protein ACKPKO_34040, partial [Candidatus Fonsibacter sp.]